MTIERSKRIAGKGRWVYLRSGGTRQLYSSVESVLLYTPPGWPFSWKVVAANGVYKPQKIGSEPVHFKTIKEYLIAITIEKNDW